MLITALTGGIATGKSLVADFFSRRGVLIIDADIIARDAVNNGMPAWQDIVGTFGEDILQPDGEINRKKLGHIIFNDNKKKQVLNNIVHPHVYQGIDNRLAEIRKNKKKSETLVIIDIPLLFETGTYNNSSATIVVYTPAPIQLERLMKRDSINEKDALARISSQMPIEKKKTMADFVIDNSVSIEQTELQTDRIYDILKKTALKI